MPREPNTHHRVVNSCERNLIVVQLKNIFIRKPRPFLRKFVQVKVLGPKEIGVWSTNQYLILDLL